MKKLSTLALLILFSSLSVLAQNVKPPLPPKQLSFKGPIKVAIGNENVDPHVKAQFLNAIGNSERYVYTTDDETKVINVFLVCSHPLNGKNESIGTVCALTVNYISPLFRGIAISLDIFVLAYPDDVNVGQKVFENVVELTTNEKLDEAEALAENVATIYYNFGLDDCKSPAKKPDTNPEQEPILPPDTTIAKT
jgi:hypothetical protein